MKNHPPPHEPASEALYERILTELVRSVDEFLAAANAAGAKLTDKKLSTLAGLDNMVITRIRRRKGGVTLRSYCLLRSFLDATSPRKIPGLQALHETYAEQARRYSRRAAPAAEAAE